MNSLAQCDRTRLKLDFSSPSNWPISTTQELLGKIEKDKSADQDNYWLIQYQKLLDSKPEGVHLAEAELDSQVEALKHPATCRARVLCAPI